MEADEAAQPRALINTAVQGSMNALEHCRGEEANHRFAKNVVFFFLLHHAIFLKFQHSTLC